MMRGAAFLLAALVLGLPIPGRAAVKSYRELSYPQIAALQDSERRLVIYDRALEQIDWDLRKRKISHQEFNQDQTNLMRLIRDEANFQNIVMTRPKASYGPDLDGVWKDLGRAGAFLLIILIRVGGGFLNGASP